MDKAKIINAIDSGNWQHSWHLPKNEHGHIDWSNPKTVDRCRQVLENQLKYANATIKINTALLLEIDDG